MDLVAVVVVATSMVVEAEVDLVEAEVVLIVIKMAKLLEVRVVDMEETEFPQALEEEEPVSAEPYSSETPPSASSKTTSPCQITKP